MAAFLKGLSGYHPPIVFNANGLLTLFPLAAAASLDVTKALDGTREAPTGLFIDFVVLHLLADGSAGSTTFELYRRRSGANTLLATLTIASASGNYARTTVTPASSALRTVLPLDRFYVQPTAAATDATDATVELQFT